jgi:hypothetical protein
VKRSECDWRTGFLDEDTVDDGTPTAGPGSDFITVDDDAPAAGSDSDNLETMVYVSSDENTNDASTSICTSNNI